MNSDLIDKVQTSPETDASGQDVFEREAKVKMKLMRNFRKMTMTTKSEFSNDLEDEAKSFKYNRVKVFIP